MQCNACLACQLSSCTQACTIGHDSGDLPLPINRIRRNRTLCGCKSMGNLNCLIEDRDGIEGFKVFITIHKNRKVPSLCIFRKKYHMYHGDCKENVEVVHRNLLQALFHSPADIAACAPVLERACNPCACLHCFAPAELADMCTL